MDGTRVSITDATETVSWKVNKDIGCSFKQKAFVTKISLTKAAIFAAAVLDVAGTIINATTGEPIQGAYMAHNTQKSLVQNMKDLYTISTDSCPANMLP